MTPTFQLASMNEAIFLFCNVLNGEKYNFLGGIYTHPIGFLRTKKGIVLEGLNMFLVHCSSKPNHGKLLSN
jgi:hypothetical protein